MSSDITLLRALLTHRHIKYETFCDQYEKAALEVAPAETPPSRATFQRWLAGQLRRGVPYPDACRVVEEMLPPWSATELFGPYSPPRHRLDSNGHASGDDSVGSLLGMVPHSFSAETLQGSWMTCFRFPHGETLHSHADIVQVTAESDRLIRARNFPPTPRSEGRASPFRNDIEGQLANRHLIGHWKNSNDTRYFGSLHLAILPGETVMEGHYTGFASDIQVSFGPWRWVRLNPESLIDVDLAEVHLREPGDLYDLVMTHSQTDAPLALGAVREDA